jgi:hypothetical protein
MLGLHSTLVYILSITALLFIAGQGQTVRAEPAIRMAMNPVDYTVRLSPQHLERIKSKHQARDRVAEEEES